MFLWKQPALGKNCFGKKTTSGNLYCVGLSFCCVALPCLVLSFSWMIKVMMYIVSDCKQAAYFSAHEGREIAG